MRLRLATWNINSVRLRIGLVGQLAAERTPDVICLQEIKCLPEQFPLKEARALGYEHVEIHGQKGYHGVAVISRHPLTPVETRMFCDIDEARHQSVRVDLGGDGRDVLVHNFYVPSGGDEPNPEVNHRFAHKLGFVDEMRDWFAADTADRQQDGRVVLVGDLNIAPSEHDVWSHKQLLNVVSHTPAETERLTRVFDDGRWVDVVRSSIPEPEKVYTWWSYRARDWRASNRGRRLDHIWAGAPLAGQAANVEILSDARSWEKPSDHVPVIADFDI